MSIRKMFPNPNWASEESDLQDMFKSFGIEQPVNNTDTTEAEPESPETEEEASEDSQQTDENNSNNAQNEPATQNNNKASQAFAQMRVQNRNMEKLLKGIAGVLGVDDSDPNQLLSALQEKVTNAQAQQQGVPPELLTRIQALEEKEREFNIEMARRNAFTGFQAVKNQFQLNDQSLQSFADELIADGLNPFEEEVDLEYQYIKRHYKDLITAAETRGAQAEMARATKAKAHGTVPGGVQGKGPAETAKITTIKELDKWLDTLK